MTAPLNKSYVYSKWKKTHSEVQLCCVEIRVGEDKDEANQEKGDDVLNVVHMSSAKLNIKQTSDYFGDFKN